MGKAIVNNQSLRALLAILGLLACGCDRPMDTPVRPLISAVSASPFAVDLEFDRPQSRASASSKLNYSLRKVGTEGPGTAPSSVQFIDTLFGETVRLVFPIGTLEETAAASRPAHNDR